ncbi:MAG: hypothetical protein OXE77_07825 [Flavobacteriaceae bacterium]|nr:hypothetical protein [Flavobacteriaceae bacterium]MCY4266441.1 hypothetical protein [Flavobacteriaceae bacterium]
MNDEQPMFLYLGSFQTTKPIIAFSLMSTVNGTLTLHINGSGHQKLVTQ